MTGQSTVDRVPSCSDLVVGVGVVEQARTHLSAVAVELGDAVRINPA